MTRTEICNAALAHIGETRIPDYESSAPVAQNLRSSWDACRRSALRSHHWNFALCRVALSADATAPQHGYKYSFALPSDYIIAIQINGIAAGTQAAEFSIEAGAILTDSATVNLFYVRDVEECSRWDDGFVEFFTYRLAARVAPAITSQPSIAGDLEARAMQALQLAKGGDSRESRLHIIRGTQNSGYAAARAGCAY